MTERFSLIIIVAVLLVFSGLSLWVKSGDQGLRTFFSFESAASEGIGLSEQLRRSYEAHITRANPHLHGVGSKLTELPGGYALWATHEYFNHQSLNLKEESTTVQRWIENHSQELKQARITRIGLMSARESLGASWYDIQ